MNGKKFVLYLMLGAILILCSTSMADWTGKNAIGIRGPLWTPYDDHWGPEPYRMGLTGSIFFKHGLSSSFTIDLSIGYATTYDDTSAFRKMKDANTKFMKKDLASSKLTNIPIGLTGNFYLLPGKKVQPYLLAGVGVDMWKIKPVEGFVGQNLSFTDFGVKGGLGFMFWLGEQVALDIQGKITYEVANLSGTKFQVNGIDFDWKKWDNRPFRGYIEPSIGLTYQFGGAKDTDQDGVNDKKDQCPDTPVGCLVDKVGCPLDADGDGVCDGLDKCPDTPKGAKVDLTGCPQDSDGDGVYDGLDKCPDTPKGCKIDATGCPIDSDGDGVCDGLDQCPDTRQGCTVDANGCPMDGDGDGVCDGLDKCPTTPPGTQVDSIGCPINVKPPVKKITLNIKYKTGSYEPDAASKKVLDDLAQTLLAYTGTNIEIDGFTDDVGKDAANQTLSENRANGVRDYLVKKGVPAERMTTKGYGENPQYFVGDNKTAEGRQMNRRVEIVSTEVQ